MFIRFAIERPKEMEYLEEKKIMKDSIFFKLRAEVWVQRPYFPLLSATFHRGKNLFGKLS
jgi:hypothetical protein